MPMNAIQAKTLRIVHSISTESAVYFTYTDLDGVTSIERTVIPKSIERCKNGQIVMRGFDLQRKASRTFRFDQITDLSVNINF